MCKRPVGRSPQSLKFMNGSILYEYSLVRFVRVVKQSLDKNATEKD